MKILFDTNILILFRQGDGSVRPFFDLVEHEGAEGMISVINRIEFLAMPEPAHAEEIRNRLFLESFREIGLTSEIAEKTIEIRRKRKSVKIPDAIVAASAMASGALLVTGDKRHFSGIDGLRVESPFKTA